MEPNRVYLGLGSNLNNPDQQIELAIKHIITSEQIQLISRSKLYQYEALVPPDRTNEIQPNFFNAVIAITTLLTPFALLQRCQQIEKQMGRIRSNKRWEARIIDIDLLLFNNEMITGTNLTIPHPEMKNRLFVLEPLFEIAPNLILPDGDSIKTLLNK